MSAHHANPRTTALLIVVVLLVALLLAAPGPAEARPAQDPTQAPATTLSADGRTVSGAGKTLTTSAAIGLAASGQTVTVSGSGYDVNKGIYVSMCVIPPPGHPPSPCGGGQDRAGSSGNSAWISSNPPDYAQPPLTKPYGPGGTFTVTVSVQAQLNATIDCRVVRCAIVTRNDHTRSSDRSHDLFIPVTFVDAPAPTTTAPPVVETTTTTAPPPPDPSTIPPSATLSADGRSVTDGTRTVSVSEAEDLDPAGLELTVAGTGFDENAGIYVALCRVPEPGAAPGPCSAGGDASAWVSSNPPDYGVGTAVPFEDGAFEVTLTVSPVIDTDTDCREVACAIATRRDDTAAADRTSDFLIPVVFGEERPTTTTTEAEDETDVEGEEIAAAEDGDSSDAGSALPLVIGLVVVLVAAGTTLVVRRRNGAARAVEP